jgi:hypothetical protein
MIGMICLAISGNQSNHFRWANELIHHIRNTLFGSKTNWPFPYCCEIYQRHHKKILRIPTSNNWLHSIQIQLMVQEVKSSQTGSGPSWLASISLSSFSTTCARFLGLLNLEIRYK